ncbi:hypothetical protein CHS0354_024914 [Potamilus streckersoni]|uniref:Uncharacterized protein n=1 Tax=Potamilus streckersoni TaxID=2493646 RepID=A0AAE0VPB2_9BIVA|nr:hypothetical protein CHS0354_024914 [Potamilus streckersoni]
MSLIHVLLNRSALSAEEIEAISSLNGTLIEVKRTKIYRDSQVNELLYVVIVIMFYAIALMVLIATQIRRQRREGQEVEYYDEYLERNDQIKSTKALLASISTVPEEDDSADVVT